MTNLLKKQEKRFEIAVNGKSEAEVIKAAFKQVQNAAYQYCNAELKAYLSELHVESFEVIEMSERVEIKKFFYFFLPKEVTHIALKAQMKVQIDYIEHGLQQG
jgi:hypothetical protein